MNGTILNLGPLEVIVIIVMALLILGPERLPGIMRGIGATLRKLRETYVAFVSEFRNELQPIAEEVDTVTREIQGELDAIREAADFRSVLAPVTQDLNDMANLRAPSSSPYSKLAAADDAASTVPVEVNAPAWGIGTDGPPTADHRPPMTADVPATAAARPMTVEEAILGPAREAERQKQAAEEAAAAAAAAPKKKPFSIDEPQPVINTTVSSDQYHRTMLMAEFSRTQLELKKDNPWGTFGSSVRSDVLDADSPWRG